MKGPWDSLLLYIRQNPKKQNRAKLDKDRWCLKDSDILVWDFVRHMGKNEIGSGWNAILQVTHSNIHRFCESRVCGYISHAVMYGLCLVLRSIVNILTGEWKQITRQWTIVPCSGQWTEARENQAGKKDTDHYHPLFSLGADKQNDDGRSLWEYIKMLIICNLAFSCQLLRDTGRIFVQFWVSETKDNVLLRNVIVNIVCKSPLFAYRL